MGEVSGEARHSRDIETVKSCGGLGIKATASITAGTVVAEAVLDTGINVTATGVMLGTSSNLGATCGPAALVNCGCWNCHNAYLWVRKRKVELKAHEDKGVRKGKELLIYDTSVQGSHKWLCPACGCEIE